MTLYELGLSVTNVRDAIDSIEIKGERNASLVVYAVRKCNDIIREINSATEKAQDKPEQEEGDEHAGQSDSGISG